MLNLASNLTRSAFVFGQRTAITHGHHVLSYRTLDARCTQLAQGLLALGVRAGETVALACNNGPHFVAAYYAILRMGAVVVPLNVMSKGGEFARYFADAGVRAVLCEPATVHEAWAGWQAVGGAPQRLVLMPAPDKAAEDAPEDEPDGAPEAAAAPPNLPAGMCTLAQLHGWAREKGGAVLDNYPSAEADTAVILYTSGTTGEPKGAQLSHSNLALNAAYSALMQKADSRDAHLVALPLFHSFAQTLQMNAAITVGAGMVTMGRFDASAAWTLMARHRVTLFAGVPTMYQALLSSHAALPQDVAQALVWRLGMSGGAALAPAVLQAFVQQLGLVLLEGYGLSETSPLATFSFPDTPQQAGSVGYPLYGTEVRIVPTAGGDAGTTRGEVQVRGHHVMQGYLGRPDATHAAMDGSWLRTGDIGQLDDTGALRLLDRAKDLIIRGGYNVYPREVEDVLLTHPAVLYAAVVGLPDAHWGEEVAAAVVLRAGHTLAPPALRAWAKAHMAAYKYPRVVQLCEALPRNATGKVLKHVLRAQWPSTQEAVV